jgi:hypothetical protein
MYWTKKALFFLMKFVKNTGVLSILNNIIVKSEGQTTNNIIPMMFSFLKNRNSEDVQTPAPTEEAKLILKPYREMTPWELDSFPDLAHKKAMEILRDRKPQIISDSNKKENTGKSNLLIDIISMKWIFLSDEDKADYLCSYSEKDTQHKFFVLPVENLRK